MLKGNDLESKKYFLFDIDGTLAIDDTIYDGSRELLDYIESIGGRAFYITNNSVKSRKDYIEKFKKWNISAVENQFVTASYATCKYLKEHYEDKKLLVVGTPSFEDELKSFGLNAQLWDLTEHLSTKKSKKHVRHYFVRKWILSEQTQITGVQLHLASSLIVEEFARC